MMIRIPMFGAPKVKTARIPAVKATSTRTGRTREFEGVRKDGERFPLEISVARVDPSGADRSEPMHFVAIIRDLSESRRLERELRLVQDLALSIAGAATVMDAMTEAIRLICLATKWDYGEAWVPTADGEALADGARWMRAGCGLEGFASCGCPLRLRPGEGLAGRAWSSGKALWVRDLSPIGPPEFCRPTEAREAGIRAAAAVPVPAGQHPAAVLVFFVRETRREDARLLELVCAATAPLATLIERKRAEEALSRHRADLERLVAERTTALRTSVDRLRMADRLASLGTLSAGLGHDMNNVLLPVRAHLNALRAEGAAGGLSPAARRHVEAIRKSAMYLQQLADGLHYLAEDPDRLDRGGESTVLSDWWSQTGAILTKAVPKHVKVRASIPRGLPAVSAGAAGLTQAVLNLVVNAGEAIPTGRKRVQGLVKITARLESGGERVRLSVSDNGAGMTEEVRRRALEMFFTTKPRGLGTGLGLPLVRKVAEGAGGVLEIESAVGKGTTVTLVLPKAEADRVRGAREGPRAGGRVRAIVTIDDGRKRALVQHLIEAKGGRATSSEHPDEAEAWIVQPGADRIPLARAWRERSPAGRLVLVGAPVGDEESAWMGLAPVAVARGDDYDGLRAAIDCALADR